MPNQNNNSKTPLNSNRGGFEKPKNLKLTVKKLFKYLHNYYVLILLAVVLAVASSIFSIVGPNKLSDLTDELSKGLVLNKEGITDISNVIKEDLENAKDLSFQILNINLNEEIILQINTSTEISEEDKLLFNTFLSKVNLVDKNTLLQELVELPSSITNIIMPNNIVNDVVISYSDKRKFIKLMSTVDKNDKELMLSTLTQIPTGIQKVLLPESAIDGVFITTNDKVKFLTTMGSIEDISDVKAIYSKVDKLPKSISSLVKPKIDFASVKKLIFLLFTLYLISAVFSFLENILMVLVTNGFARELRTKISIKINKLALKYFDSNSYGDILSRVTNDVDTINASMDQCLSSLASAFALFLGCIIMMFITNWALAITAIVSSSLGLAFMAFVLSKSQKYFTTRQVELGNLNGHIEEIYSAHNVVKAYNGNYDASQKFDKLNDKVFVCNRMSHFLSGLMPSMMVFTGHFGYVMVSIVGALLVMKGHITFGVIVAFMVYVRLFTTPLIHIAQGMTSMQRVAAASERVFEFIEEDEMEDESKLTKKLDSREVKGNIEFDHVKFGYDEDKIIIKDFSVKVKPGEKIAIVGPTGAGKTTMVNLLMKFYNINDGDILIDGTSIKELKRENIHDLFIMVLQDTWLFNGTIRDNIKYNKTHVTDEEIKDALKTVGALHFVESLPGGLDYEITDSESISAGQKQLLTIARGMIKDAPFLILDEATSSVDTRTEELVQEAMDKLTKGRTSFIIAHRLSTIKNADLILVMKDGNVIEQGNHDELMNKNGFYAELYNSQFKK